MASNVLILGAGQLGSRYLQGLARCKLPLEISVFDISEHSLTRALARWKEVTSGDSPHIVNLVADERNLSAEFDLAIVATTADTRATLVDKFASRLRIDHWVLEKVLAQSEAEIDSIEAILQSAKSAWVNTPMHMWSLYRSLRTACKPGPIQVRFDDVRGLACNAIHYVDLVSRWNDSMPAAIDTSGLEHTWYDAERPGFFDVWGSLKFLFSDGSELEVTSKHGDRNYRASMISPDDCWDIQESQGLARSENGKVVHGKCEFQSELTKSLVESILESGKCDLPSLAQSAGQHRVYLKGLLAHWNQGMPVRNSLPIT